MQYKLGGIAHRLIYWNVASLSFIGLFFTNLVQGHSISQLGCFVNRTCWFWIKAMDVRNVFVFS
jgi:hypothetical protein